MFIKLLHYIVRIVTLEAVRHNWHNLLMGSFSTIDKTSRFHPSATVVNNQFDKSKITIGANTHIRGDLLLFAHGGKISIGNNCYIGEGTRIWSALEVNIGNNVLIAHNVNIHDNISHPIDAELRRHHFRSIITTGHPKKDLDLREKKVIIKNDAWIGFNASILKGVTIGERAIVGACAVVTSDVPDDAIVVGNPAKMIEKQI